MFYNAREGNVTVNGSTMNYIEFGKGGKPFVILPGLGDGLKTVQGQAKNMALYYRCFAKLFRVYMFSRKNELDQGYTTKDMADDQKAALEQLGIESCYVMGVSQGGMIAQHLAIHYPEMVDKLVIGVSLSRQNAEIQTAVRKWIGLARSGDYKTLMIDTCEALYSPKTLKKYRLMYPILSRFGKPDDFHRFLVQANACLTHNTYDQLHQIKCPTLVIGGDSDKVTGPDASADMADKITGSKLILYQGLGHAAYEESKDFCDQVIHFLL